MRCEASVSESPYNLDETCVTNETLLTTPRHRVSYMSSSSTVTGTVARHINVLVTGGTAGIGLETIKQLLALPGPSSFHILIGSRTMPSQDHIESLRNIQSSPGTTIEYISLDLSSPQSVQNFPESVRTNICARSRDAKVDILLLCAGMSAGSTRRTVRIKLPRDARGQDGEEGDEKDVEETLYVNTLSHVDIVNRLLSMNLLADDARISIVNSGKHFKAPESGC